MQGVLHGWLLLAVKTGCMLEAAFQQMGLWRIIVA
jgi:hypothetical protein